MNNENSCSHRQEPMPPAKNSSHFMWMQLSQQVRLSGFMALSWTFWSTLKPYADVAF